MEKPAWAIGFFFLGLLRNNKALGGRVTPLLPKSGCNSRMGIRLMLL
jgi:hypothetical protein